MHSYISEQPKRKAVSRRSEPALADWRQAVVFQPTSRAALHIARKYHLPLARAATVADLAGLGSAVER